MPTSNVLVTGASGLLGRQVVNAFTRRDWAVKGTGMTRADGVSILKVDLNSSPQVEAALESITPNVVVHCAAQRFPDKVDKDPEAAKALNVAATKSLAKLCADRSILLLYISTDYVFPGTEGDAPYEADATPKAPNLYGQTKLEGEQAVLAEYAAAGKDGLGIVLRVPVLYGPAETPAESAVNVLLDTVWNAQKEGPPIKMDHWSIRYPTNTEDVGRVCHDIAATYLAAKDVKALPKILQFSSETRLTKYEICQLFAEIMGLSMARIEANTQGNDPNAGGVQRPYDCHLSTKVLRELGIDVSCNNFEGWWRREVRAFRH